MIHNKVYRIPPSSSSICRLFSLVSFCSSAISSCSLEPDEAESSPPAAVLWSSAKTLLICGGMLSMLCWGVGAFPSFLKGSGLPRLSFPGSFFRSSKSMSSSLTPCKPALSRSLCTCGLLNTRRIRAFRSVSDGSGSRGSPTRPSLVIISANSSIKGRVPPTSSNGSPPSRLWSKSLGTSAKSPLFPPISFNFLFVSKDFVRLSPAPLVSLSARNLC
mmetsp:Transcript_54806/g.107230  ORF Transcript_54806/g.107230 Transcript_54806/m.107230 type:complete len:217 (-) Transcript_54806:1831-2481(-)